MLSFIGLSSPLSLLCHNQSSPPCPTALDPLTVRRSRGAERALNILASQIMDAKLTLVDPFPTPVCYIAHHLLLRLSDSSDGRAFENTINRFRNSGTSDRTERPDFALHHSPPADSNSLQTLSLDSDGHFTSRPKTLLATPLLCQQWQNSMIHDLISERDAAW